jgi:putative transposase
VTAEKIQIVEQNTDTYGLNVTLDAIGLPKSTWYYWKNAKVDYEEKYKHLHAPLVEVVTENHAYGYRRVKPELEARGYPVGETVVQRLLGMWDLSLRRWAGKPQPSLPRQLLAKGSKGMNLVAGIGEPEPLSVFYTDFTEIRYGKQGKKAYLMPLIDHATKWVVGWAVGQRPNTELAIEALKRAGGALHDAGLTLEGCIIHHDRDAVYTGYTWLRAVLITHRARISFSENGARGNTAMESFNSRFKGENGSLFFDAANIWELGRLVAQRIEYHNRRRRHSALGYVAPIDYIIQKEILPQPALALALQRT